MLLITVDDTIALSGSAQRQNRRWPGGTGRATFNTGVTYDSEYSLTNRASRPASSVMTMVWLRPSVTSANACQALLEKTVGSQRAVAVNRNWRAARPPRAAERVDRRGTERRIVSDAVTDAGQNRGRIVGVDRIAAPFRHAVCRRTKEYGKHRAIAREVGAREVVVIE